LRVFNDYAIQPVTIADERFLWQALYYAAHMDEQPGVSLESAKTDPALAPYVAGWGNMPDLGLVAKLTKDNSAIAAAWVRLMPSGWPLHRYIDSVVPELAIAVLPEYLGRGIGSTLLAALAEAAASRFSAIGLSVRENNPARHLYERFGFIAIATIQNRVGERSVVMKLDLC
jgi:ribosomal protein S18 acetylase RimI-like enzyme